MIYTSGTTGRPKGVRRASAKGEQQARLAAMRERLYGLRAGMRGLLAAALNHSATHFFSLAEVRRKGLLVLETRFDAARPLQLVEEHRITPMLSSEARRVGTGWVRAWRI